MEIFVEVTGGLANQLFQWSAGALLAARFDGDLVVDPRVARRPWERGLQIDTIIPGLVMSPVSATAERAWAGAARSGKYPRALAKRVADALPRRGTVVGTYEAAERELERGRSVRLRGLFQDVHRLVEGRDQIERMVRPGLEGLEGATVTPLEPYAAMHVRRGDYLAVPEYAARFGVCGERYFRDALSRINPALPVLVASDDHQWVRATFADLSDRVQIFEGSTQFDDLRMLSRSTELIMSNSTFSWWAGYLGRQARTICPEPWFNRAEDDQRIELRDWIRVSR